MLIMMNSDNKKRGTVWKCENGVIVDSRMVVLFEYE